MDPIKIGLLGLGTVGAGVVKTLSLQQDKLLQRLGKKVEIAKILVRDSHKKRELEIEPSFITERFEEILQEDVDVVVEVMGGVQPAYEYIRAAILKGCHVVTANKELLARHGKELIQLANEHQVHFFYEASVAGGIPVLGVVRQFLQTNDIIRVQGIINGTTNFILTKMEQEQRSYRDVLQEAQALGYAEADPEADVEGFDALYKLYILSQLAFGKAMALESIERRGISAVSITEMELAKNMGYRFKLLAQASKEEKGIRLSVGPTLLPLEHPLSGIHDSFNAVQLTGNIVGDLLFSGRGAGEFPTASAVVEDLAYLLARPFAPQKEWSEREFLHSSKKDGKMFVFLETQHPSHVLESLEKQQVEILEAKIDRGRMGLIVRGYTSFPGAKAYPLWEESHSQEDQFERKNKLASLY